MYGNMVNDIRLIYNSLVDEESKDIFINRLLFSITGDWKYPRNIVGKYLRGYHPNEIFIGMNDNIRQMCLDTKRKYIIYGAGMFGSQVFHILQRDGIEVIAFCDADSKKQAHKYFGLEAGRTMAFVAIGVLELVHSFNIKSEESIFKVRII